MPNCDILREGTRAGQLSWSRDGLYWRFDADLASYQAVLRLEAQDAAGARLTLGTPAPAGASMRLRRRFSATGLRSLGFSPEGPLTARLLPPRDAEGTHAPAPLEPVSHPEAHFPAPLAPESRAGVPMGVPEAPLFRRAGPEALVEPFVPGRPLSLAAWFRELDVETDGSAVFLVLSSRN